MYSYLRNVYSGQEKVIRELLRNGDNVNAQTIVKRTPLHMAVYSSRSTLFFMCFSNSHLNTIGIFSLMQNSQCLSFSFSFTFFEHLDNSQTVDLLLKAGALTDGEDILGETALDTAIRRGKIHFYQQLNRFDPTEYKVNSNQYNALFSGFNYMAWLITNAVRPSIEGEFDSKK